MPGASLILLCIGEPGGRPRRWSVGDLRLPTNLVQMASLGPSRARGGSGGLGQNKNPAEVGELEGICSYVGHLDGVGVRSCAAWGGLGGRTTSSIHLLHG